MIWKLYGILRTLARTHNMGIAASVAGRCNLRMQFTISSGFGGRNSFGLLVSYLVLLNHYWAAVPDRTSNEFHTCSNTFTLCVMQATESLEFVVTRFCISKNNLSLTMLCSIKNEKMFFYCIGNYNSSCNYDGTIAKKQNDCRFQS